MKIPWTKSTTLAMCVVLTTLSASVCEKQAVNTACENLNCFGGQDRCSKDKKKITNEFSNAEGVIFEFPSKSVREPGSSFCYVLALKKDVLPDGKTFNIENCLVPCNVPLEFRKNGMTIRFSGVQTNCCDLIGLGGFPSGQLPHYGCELQISDISEIDNKK